MSIFRDRMGKELSPSETTGKIGNRFYNYLVDFGLFWLHLACYIPSHHIRRFLLRLAGAKIGKGSSIHMGCRFFSLKKLKIGEDSVIGYGAFLDGREKITIGSHTDIASEVMIYTSEHDINSEDFKAISAPVEIGDYVFIGPRAIILPGVKIGKSAVVGAGAVVTKDVGEFTVVGGVPAQVIGERKLTDPHYKLGRARLFQ
ncbi:MAG: acyltransferase [Candidatus Daviesbacteria bacterium]|nr:acyltransferase [Candidatus Daviesbacteria bacterium]